MLGGSGWRVVVSVESFFLYAWTWMRLTARGLLRFRRRGLSLSTISARAVSSAFMRWRGGKARLARDLTADDAQ